jgi:3-oxoacyl-[acyl-carrier-protein] synthase II
MNLDLPGSEPCIVPVGRCTFDEHSVRAPSKLPLDRGTAMALSSAEQAFAGAALPHAQMQPERWGLYWGSGMGGAASFEATSRAVWGDHRRIRPSSVVTSMPNAPLAELAVRFGIQGPALGYACACASAAVAIGEAMWAVRQGRIDGAIVGGSEALLVPGVVGAWQAMRVLAPAGDHPAQACRPFAAHRAGFALGEGAAAFVIESERHLRSRGAKPMAWLSGYGTTCDGRHITQPDPAGQARAMTAALADAGLQPRDVGHINAHGTATAAGDAAEAASVRAVFGAHPPAITATKAITGHLLGASGALELVATLRALQTQTIPPTGHQAPLDPAFDLDVVQGAPRPVKDLRHAMSNSFAFGGTNAVLVVSI